MRICIFDDRRTADLGPLTLTRPAADLLCGLTTLGDKQARYFGAEVVGRVGRPALADLLAARDPDGPVNDPVWLRATNTVLVNGRWLPPARAGLRVAPATRDPFAGGPVVATCAGEVAFAVLTPRHLQAVSPATIDDDLAALARTLPTREAGGHLVRYPWDLIDHNAGQIARDFETTCDPAAAGFPPTGLALVGPADRLFVDPTAKIDPLVVADTTGGPVWVGPGAVVTAFTRLEGPCAVGAGTHLLGAKVRAGTTLGPHCRVGGEVEASIVQGFTNKYHDGFLGHSVVGEWVNLAAGTTTGDLRFDYRPVSVRLNGATVPTGRMKLGSVIGDHARTGLNVLLDCGTMIGPFATLLPTGQLAPREVPAFGRAGPGGLTAAPDAEKLIATADVVMRRRGRELTPGLAAVYRALARPAMSEVGVRKSA